MTSSIRKSLIQILKRDLKNIKNKTILEIGCGDWDFAKKIIEKNGNKWFGIEPLISKITPIKAGVKKMPFGDNSFDVVLCNQSIEHWWQTGTSIKKGLKEIHRVLKNKGIIMVNAPIHCHGNLYFIRGNLMKIYNYFSRWKIILFEQVTPYKKEKIWRDVNFGFINIFLKLPDFIIPNHQTKYSYLINIHAIKE